MLGESMWSYYAYNTWANQQVLATVARLSAEELLGATHASFGSIRDTLIHIATAQRYWLARARQQPAPPDLVPADSPDYQAIAAVRGAIDQDMRAFVDVLGDADLVRIIRYTNARGEPNAYPLWQILVHQLNHAAQHRSEIALILTELGYSTGWLDYLVYVDKVIT